MLVRFQATVSVLSLCRCNQCLNRVFSNVRTRYRYAISFVPSTATKKRSNSKADVSYLKHEKKKKKVCVVSYPIPFQSTNPANFPALFFLLHLPTPMNVLFLYLFSLSISPYRFPPPSLSMDHSLPLPVAPLSLSLFAPVYPP